MTTDHPSAAEPLALKSNEGLGPDATLFARMEDGRTAESEAEMRLEEILGVDLLGIGFDTYDASFEIYPMVDVAPTPEQHAAIMALGCMRYWINFPDATEIYCGGERHKAAGDYNRWNGFNSGKERTRETERLRLGCQSALMVLNLSYTSRSELTLSTQAYLEGLLKAGPNVRIHWPPSGGPVE